MEPVRFGLVGYGFGGRSFRAPVLGAAPECELLGVVTTSPERRALVRREHPDARVFGCLAERRDAGAEAVAISTPADTHTRKTPATEGAGWGAGPEPRRGRLSCGDGAETVPTENGAWDTSYPAFAAAVRGDGDVPVPARDAIATATVLDAARRSATEVGIVRLG